MLDANAIVTTFGPAGVVVVVLIVGLKWLATQNAAQTAETVRLRDEMRKECATREEALRLHVRHLEETIQETLTEHVVMSTNAITSMSHAMHRLTDAINDMRSPSGEHRVQHPPSPAKQPPKGDA
jgi:uncharacterized coiled-coil protein SlyX